jgi:hypothetical protein
VLSDSGDPSRRSSSRPARRFTVRQYDRIYECGRRTRRGSTVTTQKILLFSYVVVVLAAVLGVLLSLLV